MVNEEGEKLKQDIIGIIQEGRQKYLRHLRDTGKVLSIDEAVEMAGRVGDSICAMEQEYLERDPGYCGQFLNVSSMIVDILNAFRAIREKLDKGTEK